MAGRGWQKLVQCSRLESQNKHDNDARVGYRTSKTYLLLASLGCASPTDNLVSPTTGPVRVDSDLTVPETGHLNKTNPVAKNRGLPATGRPSKLRSSAKVRGS